MCRALSCRLSIAERRKPCVTSTVAEIPGSNGKKSLLPAGETQSGQVKSMQHWCTVQGISSLWLVGGGIHAGLQTLTSAGLKVYAPWAQKGLEIFPKHLSSY